MAAEAEVPKSEILYPEITVTEEMLLEPFHYLSKTPGKGIRGRLIAAFDQWLRIPKDKLEQIIRVIQMLHNASLMLDDIEDNSKLRRGVPVVHAIYGLPSTINTATFVIFKALSIVTSLGNAEATNIFAEELVNLHRGQALDIYWRDNYICPTEDQYLAMVTDKTGGLFRLSIKLMQQFSENKADFVPLVNSIGLYFQILDDFINLQSKAYMENKSFCEDLTEGKFSFPIIHCIRSNARDTQLINILKQRTEDVLIKKHAVSYMKSCGSFEYTKKKILSLYDNVLEELAKLGGNDDLKQIMSDLLKQMEQ